MVSIARKTRKGPQQDVGSIPTGSTIILLRTADEVSDAVHGAMRPPETWACHKTAYCFYVEQRDEQHDKMLAFLYSFAII